MANEKVEFEELLVSIKSTRNVNEIKEKLDKDQLGEAMRERKATERRKKQAKTAKKKQTEEEVELEAALEEQRKKRHNKVLEAPLHRQARNRIESRLAYRQTKEELRQWEPVVQGLRVAEQLQFPHDERHDDPLRTMTAEERAQTFTPRTELELRMAEVLAKSKQNIRNDEEYSQAERELLKAMDVKEAQRKCAELRKMRALISFQAAKQKRQSKIKSKQFHRIRKRQQRRELITEVEQLLVHNTEKADEKLKELEKDRAYERATLKHRGTNKWTKQIRKFASRNPELRKTVEDQLRLGRELKGKHGIEGEDLIGGGSSDDDDKADEKEPSNTKELLTLAAEGSAPKILPGASQNPFYRSALENIRRERKTVAKQAREKAAKSDKAATHFDEKDKQQRTEEDKEKEEEETFLDLNVRPLIQIPAELAEGVDSDTDVQQAFLAEAYEDDDVLDDFRKRKQKVEQDEKPKAKASKYMRGWGAWTGPGISEAAEKRRELRLFGQQPKMKEQRRQDARRPGVIIREQISEGIQRHQPCDVPFPFTRIQDYEAYIRQPLGADWNTPIAHQQLCKPPVLTKGGRIIRPLDKEVKKRRQLLADIIDDGGD